MTRQTKIGIGIGFIILTGLLGFFSHRAQTKYDEARGRTVGWRDGMVEIQLIGPQQREAESAKALRNTMTILTVLAGIAAVAFTVAGLASKGTTAHTAERVSPAHSHED